MRDFQRLLGDTPMAKEIVELWQEYEDAQTPEALLVKDLDKFEMIVQALEYEKCKLRWNVAEYQNNNDWRDPCPADGKKLEQFFESTRGKFRHPAVKAWAEALYAERSTLP